MIGFIVFILILAALEYPLYKKYQKATEDVDISRQTAILILMFAIALAASLIYKMID